MDLARSWCYVQAAEGISVSGYFKGVAGMMRSGGMADLIMLVIQNSCCCLCHCSQLFSKAVPF